MFIFICMCVCLCICVHVISGVFRGWKRTSDPWSWNYTGCESPDVGTGNQTWVLWKSSQGFQPLIHLFSSPQIKLILVFFYYAEYCCVSGHGVSFADVTPATGLSDTWEESLLPQMSFSVFLQWKNIGTDLSFHLTWSLAILKSRIWVWESIFDVRWRKNEWSERTWILEDCSMKNKRLWYDDREGSRNRQSAKSSSF